MSIPQFDPWEHVEQLREALDAAALDCFERPDENRPSPEACEAAFHVAMALGYCRLFGITIPDGLDGVLSSNVAIAAADYLCESIERWSVDARNLEMLWDQSDPTVGELLCYDMLEARMDCWATFVAVDEAFEAAAGEREPDVVAFNTAMERLLDKLEEFDLALQDEGTVELLSVVAGGELLGNWKRLLADEYREPPAWWLDGGLEQVQRNLDEELEATLPRSQAQRQREQVKVVPTAKTPAAVHRHHRSRVLSITYQAATAGDTSAEPLRPFSLHWASQDGGVHASLRCPAAAVRGQTVPLEFARTDYQAAVELQGKPVRLAGVPEEIDERGVARFKLEQIQAALQDPSHELIILEVGENREEWPAIDDD